MADQTQRLEVATVRAEVGSSILYRFSNDAVDAAVIPTESGNINNLKKVILDIQTEGAEKISFATTIYPTTAAGIAATTNGAIFLVASSDADEIYAVYSNNAGTAVDTGKRAISGAAVTAAVDTATTAAAAAQTAADTATARVAGFHSPSATDPTTRDDGTALQIGDTYFNTALQSSRIYTSTGWAAQALDANYLSANAGASRVGTSDGDTVQKSLDDITTAINGSIPGSAAKLTTARTIALTGDVTGSVSFDGSGNVSTAATLSSNGLKILGQVTPAANKLPYFNAAGTATTTDLVALGRTIIGTSNTQTIRTAIQAATSGANADITSLTGLTTALSIAQGGTGAGTAAAALAALGGVLKTDLATNNDTTKGAGLVGIDGTDLITFLSSQRAGSLSMLASVAALRASNQAKLSDLVLVASHDAGLGYGGGIYRLVPTPTGTEVDNNGTIIITAASKVYRLLQSGPVNVEQFGAIRGSATNSTTAIQAAINACTHVTIGDTQAAYQYGFTTINARSGVRFSFLGGADLVKIGGVNSNSINITSTTGFIMEDWSLVVDPSVYTTSISIFMSNAVNIRLLRGKFTGFGSYGLYTGSGCTDITVDGLRVDAVGGKEQLFYWVGVDDFLINRVIVPSALNMKDPIRLHDCTAGKVLYCDIRTTADTYFGITVWGSVGGITRDVDIAFCYLQNCRREAITIGGSAKRCQAVFNNLSWPGAVSGQLGDFGMSMEGLDSSNITTECVFAWNTIQGCSLEGIGLSMYTQRCRVEYNTIIDACMQNETGWNSGVRVYGSALCTDNIVRGNQIVRISSPNLLYDVSELSPASATKIIDNLTFGSIAAGPTASTSVRRSGNTSEVETVTVAATVTGGTGLVATAAFTFSREGRWLEVGLLVTITTAGTLSGSFVVTSPFTLAGVGELMGHNVNSGLVVFGLAGTNNTNITISASNGTTAVYPVTGSSQTMRLSGRLLLPA